MADVVVITSASFSPNPVPVGSVTKLSVSVIEVTQNPTTVDVVSNEFVAGEV